MCLEWVIVLIAEFEELQFEGQVEQSQLSVKYQQAFSLCCLIVKPF